MCAKASYQQAETDIAALTGVRVSAKTQERMVKRAILPDISSHEPVTEMALDGGMVRVRTPKGQPSEWRQYHAIRLNRNGIGMAWFKSPSSLLSWVTTLPIASLLYALGDGHCGIWSLFEQMAIPGSIDEILDWFHLKGTSINRFCKNGVSDETVVNSVLEAYFSDRHSDGQTLPVATGLHAIGDKSVGGNGKPGSIATCSSNGFEQLLLLPEDVAL